jgi:two-component system, sensor histidine kinase
MARRKAASASQGGEEAVLRGEVLRLREEIAELRKQGARSKISSRRSTERQDGHFADLREANQQLVMATLDAQTATETAELEGREKERFLAMLAHELRNPLAPIVNALAIMRRTPPADPTLAWVHDIIKRQVDQLTHLLDELLEVSRLTSGKVVLKRRPIEISESMRHAIEASQPLIRGRHQHLSVHFPPQPLTVDGDPTRLVQIFSNLLHNAAKYTPEGGSIAFSAERQGDAVVLRVTDSGCGIAPEALPHVFEMFTQEHRSLSRAQGGLGIGLAVVRSLAELHGGSVEAKSPGSDGVGSEFIVVLPLVRNLPLGAASIAPVELAAPDPAFRIVVIEDNVDSNESLTAVLTMVGHEVSSAFDGKTGFEMVRETVPQIVLCDIGLPGMSGYEVVERLRETGHVPMPVMIALTGYGQAEDLTRTLAAGFDHHLTKPVDVEALLRLVATHGERMLSP